MLKLNLKTKDFWINLEPGIEAGSDEQPFKVKVRPMTPTMYNAANTYAFREVDRLKAIREVEIEEDGKYDIPDLNDVNIYLGEIRTCKALMFAKMAIVEWQGVVDGETGEPLEVTPENIEAVFQVNWVGAAFHNAYSVSMELVGDEGNASGSSPDGTTQKEEEPSTAETAGKTGSSAPGENP